jgi:hypothetical protein
MPSVRIVTWDRDVAVDLYDRTRRVAPTGSSERFTRIEIPVLHSPSLRTLHAALR